MWRWSLSSLLLLSLSAPFLWAADTQPRSKLIAELGDWGTSTVPDLTSAGTISGTDVYISTSTLSINGVIYNWPADNGAVDEILTTDGDGFLDWTAAAAGSGDSVTVNSTAVDTTANFLDGDIDWTLADGGAGGPDDITGTVACSGCVDSTDLAANSVDSSELVDGGVDLSHMSSASVDSDNIVNDSILNVDVNSAAAIAIAKTALVAGTNITLSTDTLNVDDAFIVNDADDDMDGVLTANGLTLAANENITLGAQTLDHDGTDFVFNDSVNVDASSSTITGTFVQATGGGLSINGLHYTWPATDGTANQVLHTDGSTNLRWDTDDGAGGGTDVATQVDGVEQASATEIYDWDDTDFTLTESPANDFDIVLGTAPTVVSILASGTVTGVIVDFSGVDLRLSDSSFVDCEELATDAKGVIRCASDLQSHRARLTRDAAQAISNNTSTKIAFDNEDFDVGDIGDVGTLDRVDIRRAGEYIIIGYVAIPGLDDGEFVRTEIFINGIKVSRNKLVSPSADEGLEVQASTIETLVAGDFIELFVIHNEDATQNTFTSLDRKPKLMVTEIRP